MSADAHSTSARSGPAYSRTIASWIMVSSRCVAGLSTGMRPVSAMTMMKRPAKASRSLGWNAAPRASTPRTSTPSVQRADRQRRREEPEHQRRLGERGNRHVAARAHAAERAAGVERGGRQREAAERERPDEQQDAARGFERRRRHQHRHERRRGDGRREVDARPRHVDPRCGLRAHGLLAAAASRGRSTPEGAAAPAGSGAGPSSS